MIERQSFSEGLTGVVDWASDAKANNGWCVKRITHCWVSLASAHVHNTRQALAERLPLNHSHSTSAIVRESGSVRRYLMATSLHATRMDASQCLHPRPSVIGR